MGDGAIVVEGEFMIVMVGSMAGMVLEQYLRANPLSTSWKKRVREWAWRRLKVNSQ